MLTESPTEEEQVTAEPEGSPEKGMARRIAGNSLWLIGQPLLLNLLSIASTAYITRKLGATGYGVFNLGLAEATLFAPLCNLGLRAVMVRTISSNRERAREVAGVFAALRLLTCSLAAALALFWLLRPGLDGEVRLVGLALVVSVLLTGYGQVFFDIAQGFERSRLGALPQLIGGVLLTVGSVLALAFGLGLPGFVAAYVTGAALQFGLLYTAIRRNFFPVRPQWDWRRMRAYALEARAFAVDGIVGSNTQPGVLDIVILGMVATQGEVGAYAAAIGLVSRLLIIPLGVGDALYPAVAASYGRDVAATERAARKVLGTLLLVTLPVALGIGMTAPTILNLLFGPEYLPAANALRFAALVLPLNGLSYALNECLCAARRQGDVARLTVAGAALLLVLFAVFIPIMGLEGAALSLVARDVLTLPFRLKLFKRLLGTPFAPADLGRLAAALAVMAGVLALAPGPAQTFATVGIGVLSALIYGGVAAALGLVPGFTLARLRFRSPDPSPAG